MCEDIEGERNDKIHFLFNHYLHNIKSLLNFVQANINIMATKKNFPTICPSCGGVLCVESLHCKECDTTVKGSYNIPPILRLSEEEQQFVLAFVKCSGSLKQMAADMGLSYPTVRNILDNIIEKLNSYEENF